MKALIQILTILLISQFSWAVPQGDSKDDHGKHMDHHKGGHFKKMDKNNDGKVSKDEFMIMQTEKFAKMDINNDGFVTKDEKKAHRKDKKAHRKGKNKGHHHDH